MTLRAVWEKALSQAECFSRNTGICEFKSTLLAVSLGDYRHFTQRLRPITSPTGACAKCPDITEAVEVNEADEADEVQQVLPCLCVLPPYVITPSALFYDDDKVSGLEKRQSCQELYISISETNLRGDRRGGYRGGARLTAGPAMCMTMKTFPSSSRLLSKRRLAAPQAADSR
ncbi:hypothetical protein EYF80_010277 [Liparis tanakae]|uniref:Uncharacterized protein n=1 Tax=Liparis tanakae TaxID=230148 RepID=A0A4Z2IQM3_9TELE|nr:hypothetical protein EYF80_010277 [Liparis tanakae]